MDSEPNIYFLWSLCMVLYHLIMILGGANKDSFHHLLNKYIIIITFPFFMYHYPFNYLVLNELELFTNLVLLIVF